jgi:hypothetical protein
MGIRAAYEDPAVYEYLRFKNTLAPTNCNALYASGDIRPVLITDGGTELFVELEETCKFVDPQKLPGFKEYQLKPEEIKKQEAEKAAADAAEAVRSQKLPGRNWLETREAVAAANARGKAASSSYTGATPTDIAQGEAMYKREVEAREAARSRHPSGRI